MRRNLEAVPRPCFPAPRDAQGCGSRLGPPCACASPGAAAETKISSISLLIYLLFQTASLSPLSLCHSAVRLPHFRKHLTLKKLLWVTRVDAPRYSPTPSCYAPTFPQVHTRSCGHSEDREQLSGSGQA